MARVLILGAAGMLGHKLCQHLRSHELVGLTRKPATAYRRYREVFAGVTLVGGIDVLDGEALETSVRRHKPDSLINCVGLVKQLEEASDPYLAVAINSLLPHRLVRLCDRIGARLVHISTDCVFDGRRGRYRETDPSDTSDLYGRSKALGETPQPLCGVHHMASEPITKYDLLRLVREVYGLEIEIRRADRPVSDRSLRMGSLAETIGYTVPPWSEMIRQMKEDLTPYDMWHSTGKS